MSNHANLEEPTATKKAKSGVPVLRPEASKNAKALVSTSKSIDTAWLQICVHRWTKLVTLDVAQNSYLHHAADHSPRRDALIQPPPPRRLPRQPPV